MGVSFDGIYPIKSIQLLVLHLMKYPHHIPAKRLLEDMIFLVFKTKKAAFFDGKVILLWLNHWNIFIFVCIHLNCVWFNISIISPYLFHPITIDLLVKSQFFFLVKWSKISKFDLLNFTICSMTLSLVGGFSGIQSTNSWLFYGIFHGI